MLRFPLWFHHVGILNSALFFFLSLSIFLSHQSSWNLTNRVMSNGSHTLSSCACLEIPTADCQLLHRTPCNSSTNSTFLRCLRFGKKHAPRYPIVSFMRVFRACGRQHWLRQLQFRSQFADGPRLAAVHGRLLVVGCRLSAVGCLVSVVACCLVAFASCQTLAVSCRLSAGGC